jgi:SET domain-containing protein
VNYYNKQTSVTDSDIHGSGRYALELILEGELVMVVNGRFVARQPDNKFMPLLGTDLVIACEPTYVNHSEDNNITLRGQVTFYANRNIAVGEEITMNYHDFVKRLNFCSME